MKKLLNALTIGLISSALVLIIIIANVENEKPIEKSFKSKIVHVETVTKDLTMMDFTVMYEGSFPEYSEHAIKSIVKQIVLKKNVLEILKHNSLEFIKDTLECKITPIDTAFNVILVNTRYYLRPEVQELWDEYVNAKIEAAKAEEKARNLKILYGE